MDAKELRQLSEQELVGKAKEWRDELFQARFKNQTSESRDTSVFPKLRKNIARVETVLSERRKASKKAPQDK